MNGERRAQRKGMARAARRREDGRSRRRSSSTRTTALCWSRMCSRCAEPGPLRSAAGAAAPAMTRARAGAAGGRWISGTVQRVPGGRRAAGRAAASMGWWSRRCRGLAMAPGTRWSSIRVAWLAVQCSKTAVTAADADRVAHRRRDHHPGVGRRRGPRRSAWRGCAGSGSTRSATSGVTATSPWSSITTPGDWCGPHPAGTGPRCGALLRAARPRPLRG